MAPAKKRLAALAMALATAAPLVAQTDSAPLTAVATANNRLAVDLYRDAALKGPEANLFFSPFSIFTTLSMAYVGAAGRTQTQMAATLHFSSSFNKDDAARRSETAALLAELTSAPGKSYQLNVANALWGEKQMLLPSFVATMEHTYKGGVRPADFQAHPAAAVEAINQWTAEQTAGKIAHLLSAGDVDASTRLILTNAIYFKAAWQTPFSERATADHDFHLASGQTGGQTVQTPTMDKRLNCGYMEDGAVQAVELPYKDGDLSMVVVLPKASLAGVESKLSYERLTAIEKALAPAEVHVALPRFSFSTRTYLEPALTRLGMGDAFNRQAADFSRITGHRDLAIEHVVHQAYIAVDEHGSEAAAATAVTFSMLAMRNNTSKPFIADHPFLFFILDKKSGAILFLGRVEDPRSQF